MSKETIELNLKEELLKLGFKKRALAKDGFKNELITLNSNGSLTVKRKRVLWPSKTQTLENWPSVKKIKHRPGIEPIIAFGVAGAIVYDNFISFHNDIAKDSPTVLKMDDLWLFIPDVQDFLLENIPKDISNDLKLANEVNLFYSSKSDSIGGIYASAEFNKETKKWEIST